MSTTTPPQHSDEQRLSPALESVEEGADPFMACAAPAGADAEAGHLENRSLSESSVSKSNLPMFIVDPSEIPVMIILLLFFGAVAQNFGSIVVSSFVYTLGFTFVQTTNYWNDVGNVTWFQPIVGLFADLFVVLRDKRRPLIIFGSLINAIIFLIYSTRASDFEGEFVKFEWVSILSQVMLMLIYVPLNGALVEVSRVGAASEAESTARLSCIVSMAMVWRSLGSLAACVIQICLNEGLSYRQQLGFASGFYWLMIPLTLLTPRKYFYSETINYCERAVEGVAKVRKSVKLWDLRCDAFCFMIILTFCFVYTMLPDVSMQYYPFYTFPKWLSKTDSVLGYLAPTVGAYVFAAWMDFHARRQLAGGPKVRTSVMFIAGTCSWLLSYIPALMLSSNNFADNINMKVFYPIMFIFVTGALYRFAFMPTIVMAAEHTPDHYEALTFEIFTTATYGGARASSKTSLRLFNSMNMTSYSNDGVWKFILVCAAIRTVCIPVSFFLPDRRHSDEAGADCASEDDAAAVHGPFGKV